MSEVFELALCLLNLSFLLLVEHGDDSFFACEFVVEVGDIVDPLRQFRDEGCFYLFGSDHFLVQVLEPGM